MKKSLKMIQVSALILAMGSSIGVARGDDEIRKLTPAEQAERLRQAEQEAGRTQAIIQAEPQFDSGTTWTKMRVEPTQRPVGTYREIRKLTPAEQAALQRQVEQEEGRDRQATIQEKPFTSGTTFSRQLVKPPQGEHMELISPEAGLDKGKADSLFPDKFFTDNNECPECGLDEKQLRKALSKEMLQRIKLKARLDYVKKAQNADEIQRAQKELDANQVTGLRLLNRSRQLRLEAQQRQLDSKKSSDVAAKSCAPGVQDTANTQKLQRAIEGGLSSPDVPSYGTGGGGARSPAAANVNE